MGSVDRERRIMRLEGMVARLWTAVWVLAFWALVVGFLVALEIRRG